MWQGIAQARRGSESAMYESLYRPTIRSSCSRFSFRAVRWVRREASGPAVWRGFGARGRRGGASSGSTCGWLYACWGGVSSEKTDKKADKRTGREALKCISKELHLSSRPHRHKAGGGDEKKRRARSGAKTPLHRREVGGGEDSEGKGVTLSRYTLRLSRSAFRSAFFLDTHPQQA